jgi:hypothetical protein
MDEAYRALERFEHKRTLEKAEDIAESARAKADDMASRITRLEGAVQSLTMISRALWEIVRRGASLNDQELREQVSAIRAQQIAVREQPKVAPQCKQCSRPLEKGRETCIYCGAVRDDHDVFDSVM